MVGGDMMHRCMGGNKFIAYGFALDWGAVGKKSNIPVIIACITP